MDFGVGIALVALPHDVQVVVGGLFPLAPMPGIFGPALIVPPINVGVGICLVIDIRISSELALTMSGHYHQSHRTATDTTINSNKSTRCVVVQQRVVRRRPGSKLSLHKDRAVVRADERRPHCKVQNSSTSGR